MFLADEADLVCPRPVVQRRRSHGDKHLERKHTMTQRATTSLSLHYQVKAGQREWLLVEIRGTLDRCAKEPDFIPRILPQTPDAPTHLFPYTLSNQPRPHFYPPR